MVKLVSSGKRSENSFAFEDLLAFTFIVNDDFCTRISTNNETSPDCTWEEHWTPCSGLLPFTMAMASLHCRLRTLFCRIRITRTHSNRRSPYMRWSLYFKGNFCSKGVLSDPTCCWNCQNQLILYFRLLRVGILSNHTDFFGSTDGVHISILVLHALMYHHSSLRGRRVDRMQDIDPLCKIEAPSNMMYSLSFSIIHKC